jgi:hypothetical protein
LSAPLGRLLKMLFNITSDSVAHQRIIRERKMAEEPRTPARSLDGYTVETVGRVQAASIISKYEWLGTMGRATIFIGLFSPIRELEGVVCFGHGPAGAIRNLIGSPALCLERGACVHYAPPNAASFLISRACKLIYRLTGVASFFAYGDPMAGEYGAVYQAAGWTYLGQGLNGGGKVRTHRAFFLPPGADGDDPANWKTTRALRRGDRAGWMTWEEAEKKGWRLGYREAKHVYAVNVGRDRRHWLKGLITRPYPAPRPYLKIKPATPMTLDRIQAEAAHPACCGVTPSIATERGAGARPLLGLRVRQERV